MDIDSVDWRRLAYLSCAALSVSIAYSLFHVPFEVGDTLNTLLRVDASSISDIFWSDLSTRGFVRPLTVVTSKALFETGRVLGAHYFLVYRTAHVALIALLLTGTVKLLRVSTFVTYALAMLSVAAVIGAIPFHQAVHETELNMKLIMATACMMAVVLAASPRHWWSDLAAVALAIYAMFANELGLLVWVGLVVAYIAGFRGVSFRAVAVVTAMLGVYFYLRFVRLSAGAPGLAERSSGYGFSIRSPQELGRMFGAHPLPFYAYNVVASALAVLLSEPSNGVFVFVRNLLAGRATAAMYVNVMSSTLTTLVIVWYVVRSSGAWVKRQLTYHDRLFFVAIAIIGANAAISFPYTKDVTMVPATTFFSIAMFVPLQALVRELRMRRVETERPVAMYAVLAIIAVGWSIRSLSFYADMRIQSYKAQTDWVFLDDWMRNGQLEIPAPRQRGLAEQFRAEMIGMEVPKVYLDPPWIKELLTTE
jgi:hypothetical protein